MDKTAAAINEIKSILGTKYLEKSGGVFLTGSSALKRGKYYILGLNPGTAGNKGLYDEYTIEHSLNKTVNTSSGLIIGKSKFQERLIFLLNQLDTDESSTCVSNLIFKRSSGKKTLDYYGIEKCFEVHKKLILDIIRPQIIIVIGRGTYFLLKRLLTDDLWKFEGSRQSECAAGHGNWKVFFREFTNKDDHKTLKVVNVPHLSWYAINKGKEEAIQHIREFCR